MIRGVDTVAYYFSQRLKTINPNRVYKGYMNAQQWPPSEVIFDAFYLLVLGNHPRHGESIAVPIYNVVMQFVWINKGTDVNNANNVVGANRGDRFRTCQEMKEELVQALWPFFTQKVEIDVQSNGALSAETTNEPIYWSKPEFATQADKASGLLYATASVRLTDMTRTIQS